MELKELRKIKEKLKVKLRNILPEKSCIHSKVSKGRIWYDSFNIGFTRRGDYSCPGYENKYLTNKN